MDVGGVGFVRDTRATGFDSSFGDEDVADGVHLLRWIDYSAASEENLGHREEFISTTSDNGSLASLVTTST
jgi:hypothetical protein